MVGKILQRDFSDATRIGFEKLIQFFVSSPKFKVGFEHWNELRIDAIRDAIFYENSNTKIHDK